MDINYHLLNNSIVLNYDGKTFTIAKGDGRFNPIVEALNNGQYERIPIIVDTEEALRQNGMDVIDGMIVINGEAMPQSLHKRIIEFKNHNLPFDRLNKFWENLRRNPSFNSRKMLYKFLEHNGHPLTSDGCFIAYRGVTDEFKDCRTQKFDNSPGSVCEVSRSQVDDNPDNTCSFGLHVACHDYASGFGEKTIEVKVNPADVVAVPHDYDGTKMRVCKFEVIRECDGIKEEPVYDYDEECSYCNNSDGHSVDECYENEETF